MKKVEATKLEMSAEAIQALEEMRKETDPAIKKEWAELIREIEQARVAEMAAEAKSKENWLSKVDPSVVVGGLFGTAQILLILFGEDCGRILNGRASSYIMRLRSRV